MLVENQKLAEFAALVSSGDVRPFEGPLKVGVDLGTANIVMAVTDQDNRPVAGMTTHSTVVRDGIVVDYVGRADHESGLRRKIGRRPDQGGDGYPTGHPRWQRPLYRQLCRRGGPGSHQSYG